MDTRTLTHGMRCASRFRFGLQDASYNYVRRPNRLVILKDAAWRTDKLLPDRTRSASSSMSPR